MEWGYRQISAENNSAATRLNRRRRGRRRRFISVASVTSFSPLGFLSLIMSLSLSSFRGRRTTTGRWWWCSVWSDEKRGGVSFAGEDHRQLSPVNPSSG
ncbi:hypothetical protein Hanom_Chr11g01022451 [Helianthus anomalus]